jgi:hypothetical protein
VSVASGGRLSKKTMDKTVIISGEYFAIFDLEEFALLVDNPPLEFRNVDPEKVKKE